MDAVELLDGLFGEGDEAPQEFVRALDGACRVAVEKFGDLDETGRFGREFSRDLPHSCVDSSKVGVAPGVEFVEIENRAVPVLAPGAIALETAVVVLVRSRRQLVPHPRRKLAAGRVGVRRRAHQFAVVASVWRDATHEVPVTVIGVRRRLLSDAENVTTRRKLVVRRQVVQGTSPTLERATYLTKSLGDDVQLVRGSCRHQLKDLANLRHRRTQH